MSKDQVRYSPQDLESAEDILRAIDITDRFPEVSDARRKMLDMQNTDRRGRIVYTSYPACNSDTSLGGLE